MVENMVENKDILNLKNKGRMKVTYIYIYI